MGPIWVQWIFSVACLGVGGYYAAASVARRGEPRTGARTLPGSAYDLPHLAMALGMAAMFSPLGDPVPRLAWVIVFALSAAWFASWALRDGLVFDGLGADTTAHHLVANLAMLFMLMTSHQHGAAGAASGQGHEGHTGAAGGSGLLAGSIGTVLTVILAGYFVVHTARSLRAMFATRPFATRPFATPLFADRNAPQPAPAGMGSVAVAGARRGSAQKPRTAAACHGVMGIAMTVMLGLML